eukprot:snap_masked-scaffold_13-processed-gene-4.32-mRNA-1 protein AED:1.00 eAED:1.00 QI:0/-1/0/0/-1/1/1/0/109
MRPGVYHFKDISDGDIQTLVPLGHDSFSSFHPMFAARENPSLIIPISNTPGQLPIDLTNLNPPKKKSVTMEILYFIGILIATGVGYLVSELTTDPCSCTLDNSTLFFDD